MNFLAATYTDSASFLAGVYFANLTRSQALRKSLRRSFWSSDNAVDSLKEPRNSSVVISGAFNLNDLSI